MSGVFSEQILADKLTKLNNTQQCIETLSHWCIFHRKDAEKIIRTWDKQFHNSDKERRIPFLYLANDILQNSKKNGKEFVEEFWKVLPSALREMSSKGDDRAKNVVSRLVDIWEERRVFGSRPKGLKDLMLGDEPLPKLELNKKRSRTDIKIVRRDSRSVRIKLSIGGTAEKIISAFNAVLNEEIEEDSDLEKCKLAIKRVVNLEKDVENASNQVGDIRKETLSTDLKAEENSLRKCVERLKSVESSRAELVSQLKEALKEQESELEKVRTQIQLAAATKDQVANLQRWLNNEPILIDNSKLKKKSSAAEVADRLAASSHSTQIMSSVLSSFIENTNTNNNNTNTNNNNANNINNNNTNNNSNSNVSSGSNTGVYMIGMPYGYGGPPPPVPATAPATLGFVRPIMPPQPPNIGLVPINGQMMPVNQQNPGLQNPGLQFGHPPGFRMPFYPPPS